MMRDEIRYGLPKVMLVLEDVLDHLAPLGAVTVHGSVLRGEHTVGDIDVLVAGATPDQVRSVLGVTWGQNPVRCKVDGVLVEVWTASMDDAPAVAMYLDGPLSRNIRMRKIAVQSGLRWSIVGLFDGDRLVTNDPSRILHLLGERS